MKTDCLKGRGLIGLLLFVCLLCAVSPATAAERPNIVLLMGDDHGWDETAYNGHPYLKTPVLDEMAATGLRLDRFYSGHPSCSPTRGTIITGRHPNRYGTFAPNWSIRPEEISIARILKDAGYQCGHFGKWHLGPVKKGSPTNPGAFGFHEWVSHDNFFEMDPVLSRNGEPPKKFPGEGSEVVIDETMRFIGKSTQAKQPFFTVVWFGSPHEPYSGLEQDLALYDTLPQELQSRMVSLTSMTTGKQTKRPLREVLRERYAEITAMDRAIGRLRDYLKAEGLRGNTLVWYCGDNGVPGGVDLATPSRGAKGQMYDGGIRVPGIIEWPDRIKTPRTSAVNSVTSDMLPTICELVGKPVPNRPLDGISLKPLLDGKMTSRPEPIFFWSYNTGALANRPTKPWIPAKLQEGTTPLVKMMAGRFTRNFRNVHQPPIVERDYTGPRVILDNDYKLVVDAGEKGVELFAISDIAEEHNLAEAKPEIAAKLGKQLRDWQTSVLKSLSGADY